MGAHRIGPPTRGHHRTVPILLQQFDMVAQSGSITERIQSYILPILQLLYTSNSQNSVGGGGPRPGLQVLIITATFDEASQAHRLANGIGSTLGIRAALCAGAAPPGPTETLAEVQRFQSMSPHILLGTPQRLHDLLAVKGALDVDGLTMLVVDEVDQILARNLHEFVTDIITHFLRSSGSSSSDPVVGSVGSGPEGGASAEGKNKGRQTCIVSCTVPQDVLTYAQTLKLREPVRVLVRRDETQQGIPQIRGLRQFYVYIATPALLAPAIPTSTATLTAANANPVSLPNGTSTAPGSPVLAAAKQQREAEREGKLEAFVDLLERWEFANCVVYCNSVDSVETVALRLQNRGIGALSLVGPCARLMLGRELTDDSLVYRQHQDMGNSARLSVLARFRSQATTGPTGKKALVVYDALARTLSDNHQVQLVINYELPRAVGDYIHRCVHPSARGANRSVERMSDRVACATHQGRGGTVINVVTPGQDLDTLRSIENYCPSSDSHRRRELTQGVGRPDAGLRAPAPLLRLSTISPLHLLPSSIASSLPSPAVRRRRPLLLASHVSASPSFDRTSAHRPDPVFCSLRYTPRPNDLAPPLLNTRRGGTRTHQARPSSSHRHTLSRRLFFPFSTIPFPWLSFGAVVVRGEGAAAAAERGDCLVRAIADA